MEESGYQKVVDDALSRVREESFIERIWARDATLWCDDQAERDFIRSFLGWLDSPDWMRSHVEELIDFSEDVRANFDFVVLLGMGGSSLCPEVLRRVFGRQEGWPELIVLDSVVPAAVQSVFERIDLPRTLFIVASKSGGTIEPNSLYKVFFDRVDQIAHEEAGRQFVAITDDGTSLEKEAGSKGFRRVFINPSDIGGRFSALSMFGCVPAAAMGLDVLRLLDRANEAINATAPTTQVDLNPAALLGAAMGALSLEGQDKLTLITSPKVESLGLWIEQLVAESTGKEEKGILPIAQEPACPISSYSLDRLFVGISFGGDASVGAKLDELEKLGYPVIELSMRDAYDLASQFFLWEIATAVAGAFLRINPFNQPNVQEAKDKSREVLSELVEKGVPSTDREFDGEALRDFVGSVESGDYVSLLLYVQETSEHDDLIASIRSEITSGKHVVTTAGYGPRYLHSTGQFHKGGPNRGLYLVVTADEGEDIPVPGESYTLGMLARAQALGDIAALEGKGRRVRHVHLGNDVTGGLKRVLVWLTSFGSPG